MLELHSACAPQAGPVQSEEVQGSRGVTKSADGRPARNHLRNIVWSVFEISPSEEARSESTFYGRLFMAHFAETKQRSGTLHNNITAATTTMIEITTKRCKLKNRAPK